MIVIDVSYYQQYLSQKQWDLLSTFVDGVIIRLVFGTTFDSFAAQAIKECESRGIPWTGYGWVDPTKSIVAQQSKFIEAIQVYKPPSLFNDYEQYWTDWAAYMRQDIVEAKRTKFTSLQLNAYYRTFHNWCKVDLPVPTGNYTARWFIDEFCPEMDDWVWQDTAWEARYLRYYDAVWFTSMKVLWGKDYDISKVKVLAEHAKIVNGVGRQFESYLEINGLGENIGYHLDWNVFTDESFYRMFGVNVMGTNIDMQFVSQLGEGAGMHNNDCGPACCSMVILEGKDIFVSPDELYKLDGWGAPSTDIGTNSYQLQKILSIFDVPSSRGTSLDFDIIKSFIDKGFPIVTLVKYSLFSAAGLTVNKGTFNHWLIVTGYTNTDIITLDPYRPYEAGGKMIVPISMFTASYLGSYLLCEISKSTEVQMANATVNNLKGVNIRKTLPLSSSVLGEDIGDLWDKQRVTLKEPVVDHQGADGLVWVELVLPKIGWVAKKFFIIDTPIPPVIPPVPLDEKPIRLDELNKAEVAMQAYFAFRKNEINKL